MTASRTNRNARGGALLLTALAMATAAGCGKTAWTPTLHPADSVPEVRERADRLKVHMRNGELYVLHAWRVDRGRTYLEGGGSLYSMHRNAKGSSNSYAIPLDSVALLEVNERRSIQKTGISWLGIWATYWGGLTIYCVSDPKACFGSCPTFYVYDGAGERLQAEGFSSSVAKMLEASDLDALYLARPRDGRLEIRMKNEALETHAVRRTRLHAVPRQTGTHVFADAEGTYYLAAVLTEPSACRAPEGDCIEPVRALDASERMSVTDSADLAAREEIYLEFPRRDGPAGLVLSARNTFVTTYLIYQSMAYMGSRAGELLAQLERGDPALKQGAENLLGALGGIEIAARRPDGSWAPIGVYSENGPIAADIQLFRFEPPDGDGPITLRLRMAKGSWRVGYAALADLTGTVTPLVLEPSKVWSDGRADVDARAALIDPDRYLFTYPGDQYVIVFQLPDGDGPFEFFLESQGYYYEWMRAEWLKEEDPAMLALLLMNPQEALRRLAPQFKRVESQMEELFWSSRFGGR